MRKRNAKAGMPWIGIMRRLYSSIENGVCDWRIRPWGTLVHQEQNCLNVKSYQWVKTDAALSLSGRT
jgi:hypothetical protein